MTRHLEVVLAIITSCCFLMMADFLKPAFLPLAVGVLIFSYSVLNELVRDEP